MKQLLCPLLLMCATVATSFAQTSPFDDSISKGIALYDDCNYKGALAQYQQALKLKKRNPELNYEVALTYFALNDIPNTIRYSRVVLKSLNAFPELKAQAHVTRGSALDVAGKPDQALKDFRKALKLDPTCSMAYYNMGLSLESV